MPEIARFDACVVAINYKLGWHGPALPCHAMTAANAVKYANHDPASYGFALGASEETEEASKRALALASQDSRKRDAGDKWAMLDAGSPALAKIAATVIRRINYPKALAGKVATYVKTTTRGKAGDVTRAARDKSLNAKAHRLLSAQDERDVFQTVAIVLHASGHLLESDIPRPVWKRIFSACREELGIDRKRNLEVATDPQSDFFTLQEYIETGHDFQRVALARQRLAGLLWQWKAAIHATFRASDSRKRKSVRKKQIGTLRTIAADRLRFRGEMTQSEHEQASKALADLQSAVSVGKRALGAEAKRREAQAIADSMLALW